MLDQPKIRSLSDEDVDSYIKSTSPDGSVGVQELQGAVKEEIKKDTSVKPESKPKEDETSKDEDSSVNKKKEVLQFTDEDAEGALEEIEDTEVKEKKITKKEIQNSIGYKDMASLLIEEGDWEPIVKLEDGTEVDLREVDEAEFTKDVYANLVKYQNSLKVSKTLEEEKSSYGQDANELLEYLKKGGKLEKIADFYKQQSDVDSLDVTKPEGAAQAIREYLEAIGEESEDITSYIEMIQDRGEDFLLKDGAKKKAKLKEAVDEQKQEEFARQAELEEQRKIAEAQSNQRLREVIYKDTLTDREKKEFDKYRFEHKFDHPHIKGQKVNQFFVDFQKVQNDPEKYFELMKFTKSIVEGKPLKDPKKVETEVKNKLHTFMRKNQIDLTRGSSEEPIYQGNKKNTLFDLDKVNKILKNKI